VALAVSSYLFQSNDKKQNKTNKQQNKQKHGEMWLVPDYYRFINLTHVFVILLPSKNR
jgi:C4-dicarboxylate transporter